jgi:hypothetical protein
LPDTTHVTCTACGDQPFDTRQSFERHLALYGA